jgi:hypothetical protein
LDSETKITEVGDYIIIHSFIAMSGTISKSNFAHPKEIEDFLSTHVDPYILIPKSQISLYRCLSFPFFQKIILMNPPRLQVDLPLKEWTNIENLSESECIFNIPESTLVSVHIFYDRNDINSYYKTNSRLNFSNSRTIDSIEIIDALKIYTRHFLGVNMVEFKMSLGLNKDTSIEILALLMEESSIKVLGNSI